jgi:hypothetical protein
MQDHDFQRVFSQIFVAKLPKRDQTTSPSEETKVVRRTESVWDEEERAWVLPVSAYMCGVHGLIIAQMIWCRDLLILTADDLVRLSPLYGRNASVVPRVICALGRCCSCFSGS